jgi:hypothetical protein
VKNLYKIVFISALFAVFPAAIVMSGWMIIWKLQKIFAFNPKLQLVAYLYKNKASTVFFLGALLGLNLPHLWLQ